MTEPHKFLIKGQEVLIDKEKATMVMQHKWVINCGYMTRYVVSNKKRTTINLSRFLLAVSNGQYVDHINGNTLDNRLSNLKICTASELSFKRWQKQRENNLVKV